MRGTLFILVLLGICSTSFSQSGELDSFYFRAMEEKLNASDVDPSYIRNHFLGEKIAKKMFLVKEGYTWVEEGSATSPTSKTYIDKPAIYNSIRKLEKYYKKGIKSGNISKNQATIEFGKILDIVIYIRNQETEKFEAVLDDLKEENQIASLFTEKVELSY